MNCPNCGAQLAELRCDRCGFAIKKDPVISLGAPESGALSDLAAFIREKDAAARTLAERANKQTATNSSSTRNGIQPYQETDHYRRLRERYSWDDSKRTVRRTTPAKKTEKAPPVSEKRSTPRPAADLPKTCRIRRDGVVKGLHNGDIVRVIQDDGAMAIYEKNDTEAGLIDLGAVPTRVLEEISDYVHRASVPNDVN